MFKLKYPSGIYGFMHISVMNNWKEVVNDQLNLIHESGLYDKCDKVFASVLGPTTNLSFIEDRGVEILNHGYDLSLGDVFGLRELYKFTKQNINNSKLWFIHTKGISRPWCHNSYCWRKYMEYFVIEKHRDCIEALDQGYDCCGVQWVDYGWKAAYIGNFWWTTSSYVKRLPPDVLTGEHWNDPCAKGIRWAAEFNFISRGNPRVKNLHTADCCLYDRPYTRDRYLTSPKFI